MTDRIPPLAALRAFAAVARHGSFARAALALHVSTSAVSHQIRGLEATLGASPADAGPQRRRPHADRRHRGGRVAAARRGGRPSRSSPPPARRCASAHAATRPMLAISANGSVASLWLAPRLAAFAALHPSVQWQVRAIEEEPDLVREGLDLAILRVSPGQSGGGRPAAVQRDGVPGVQPIAVAGRRDAGPAAAQSAAGGSRQQPGKGLVHLARPAWHAGPGEADDCPVRYLQRRHRCGGRGRRHRARTPAADRFRACRADG